MSVFKRWNGTSWETIGPQISSARFDDTNHMIAPEYSSTDIYNVGDYVVQSDKLYKCISVIEEIEEWTPAHWTQVSMGEEVSDLKSDLDNKIGYNLKTVSGTEIYFNDGQDNLPIRNLQLTLPVIQSGTGNPNYDNIRSFVPHSGITIEVTDKGDTTIQYPVSWNIEEEIYYGILSYEEGNEWTLTPKYCKVSVPYTFFSNATSKGIDTADHCFYFQNAFYSNVTYRVRTRKSGGYYCKSNVLTVFTLNNSSKHSTQNRLYIRNINDYSDINEFLADLQNFYNQNGEVEFVYEPTDQLPIYHFSSSQIKTLMGVNYISNNLLTSMTLTYKTSDVNIIANNFAGLYNPNITYTLNDFVIYNNKLYKSKVEITTPEEWTPAHWTKIYITDELEAKINNITKTASGQNFIASNCKEDKSISYTIKTTCIQTGEGTPSPSNLYDLTGINELNIEWTDKNNNTRNYKINFPENAGYVYGATLSLNNNIANFTITHWPYTVTSGKLDGAPETGYSSTYGAWARNLNYNTAPVPTRTIHWASSGYKNICNGCALCVQNNGNVSSSQQRTSFKSSAWSNYQEFYNAVKTLEEAGTPLKYIAELRDPINYQIDLLDLTLFKGDNTVSIDNGTMTLEYYIDIESLLNNISNKQEENEEEIKNLYLPSTKIITANQDAINKIWASRWMKHDTEQPLTLLWFSDIHRWDTPFKRIIEFKKYLQSLSILDDTIVTGDLVRNSSDEGNTYHNFWYQDGADDILITLGNHDHYNVGSQPHGKATFEKLNTVFFQDIDKWNVVRESNYPFYYKDYPTQRIRLIVADPGVTDQEAPQTQWLNNTLEEAKLLEYSVIVAAHYLRLNNGTAIKTVSIYNNNWSNIDSRKAQETTMSYDWSGTDIVNCVTNFIDNGGNFICYLIGHTHSDIIGYPTGHPEQLIINVCCASPDRAHETSLHTNDLPRYPNTRTQDAFNILTFDNNRKILKGIRIGANITMQEEPRTAFGYNWDSHEFISLI